MYIYIACRRSLSSSLQCCCVGCVLVFKVVNEKPSKAEQHASKCSYSLIVSAACKTNYMDHMALKIFCSIVSAAQVRCIYKSLIDWWLLRGSDPAVVTPQLASGKAGVCERKLCANSPTSHTPSLYIYSKQTKATKKKSIQSSVHIIQNKQSNSLSDWLLDSHVPARTSCVWSSPQYDCIFSDLIMQNYSKQDT